MLPMTSHRPDAGPPRAEPLQEALARCGCRTKPADFRRLVRNWLKSLYPRRAPADFLKRSRDVKRFCAVMRAVFACETLTDETILLALTNKRAS